MPISDIFNYLAIACYIAATGYLSWAFFKTVVPKTGLVVAISIIGLIAHGIGLHGTLWVNGGINYSVFKLPALFFFVVNLMVLISGFRKPLYNLFILLFPLSILALLSATTKETDEFIAQEAFGHILLAILATGFLTLATLQAIVMAYQNHLLRSKQTNGVLRLLPPLQTMESLTFELIWIGELMLTLLIVSGFIIIEDIAEQRQAHTLALSLIAWLIYAILLWGRHRLGWRGNTAVKWTLGGYAALMLAYMGTQLVYQVVLSA